MTQDSNEAIERVARKLRMSGTLSAKELRAYALVSQPQLSRYLNKLADKVLKIGRGKNTTYAHTRDIPQVANPIHIFAVDTYGNLEEVGKLYSIAPKGFYWMSNEKKNSRVYDDLPYFLNDLRPSGYLGRLIPLSYPDWEFPKDIRLWSAESTLRYLANFGVDVIGNYIVGEKAAQKFLNFKLQDNTKPDNIEDLSQYEFLARSVEVRGIPGSSAGGEHPKFLTQRASDGISVIVKFVPNNDNPITKRRIDLLRAEHIASQLLVDTANQSHTRILVGDNYVFLEVVRFDRINRYGRRGLISLLSLDAQFVGSGDNWGSVAEKLYLQKIINLDTLHAIYHREYFGQLIGNTDMHGGNLSFYFENQKVVGLAPSYDMLPMIYAPVQERLSSEAVKLLPPKPSFIWIWEKARKLAVEFWKKVEKSKEFSPAFIDIAKRNQKVLSGED